MNLDEAKKRMKLKWSPQALVLLESFKDDFDIEGCEKWVEENKQAVGGAYVIEFLENKK